MGVSPKNPARRSQESGENRAGILDALRFAPHMDRFSLTEAQHLLDSLLPLTWQVVDVRADLVAANDDPTTRPAERKALEALLADLLDQITARGAQIKGWAPLLLDFPGERDGRPVCWCWLEGESTLAWYHDEAHGFAGRRRLET